MKYSLNTQLSTVMSNRVRINALKAMGIENIQELLYNIPRKLEPPAKECRSISVLRKEFNLNSTNTKYIIPLEITNQNIHPMAKGYGSRLEFTLKDKNNQSIQAVFYAKSYKYLSYLKSTVANSKNVVVVGSLSVREKLMFVHPQIIPYYNDDSKPKIIAQHLTPTPIYSATKKISSDKIHDTILQIIRKLESNSATETTKSWEDETDDSQQIVFPSILPPNLINPLFATRFDALKALHEPKSVEQYEAAYNQLKLEEAFILQTVLAIKKSKLNQKLAIRRIVDDQKQSYCQQLIKSLGFKLTKSQMKVYQQISKDLSSSIPMRRLLQGDVGSGKTVVALLSMLQVIESGGQAVLIAPTEVLASQHFEYMLKVTQNIFDNASQRVVMLSGSLKQKQKDLVKARIRSNQAKLIIGTHALFYDIEFSDLGIIVIDEQHRFGVEQRDNLLHANDNSHNYTPHMLIMSATPIPRTMAMTIFSDLDVSVIDEMPDNRRPIKTFIVERSNQNWYQRMWQRTQEELDNKNNVFVVVARIDDNSFEEQSFVADIDDRAQQSSSGENEISINQNSRSTLKITQELFYKLSSSLPLDKDIDSEAVKSDKNLASITSTQKLLESQQELTNYSYATIHGKMKSNEKDEAMEAFINKTKPILLATSVIEVGIDVKDATVMIIFDADMFSLSTLHQLRGRIGRGDKESICFLIPSKNITDKGHERLKVIANTFDGFKIAEEDLRIRSEGDVVGSSQSGGQTSLKMLKVLRDREIIEEAYTNAKLILEKDPLLKNHIGLKIAVDLEIDKERKDFVEKF